MVKMPRKVMRYSPSAGKHTEHTVERVKKKRASELKWVQRFPSSKAFWGEAYEEGKLGLQMHRDRKGPLPEGKESKKIRTCR
jgi:hypothetical protein